MKTLRVYKVVEAGKAMCIVLIPEKKGKTHYSKAVNLNKQPLIKMKTAHLSLFFSWLIIYIIC
jgi:hypothetical protein